LVLVAQRVRLWTAPPGARKRFIDADLQHDGSNWDEEIQVRTSGPVVKATVGF
jgi:hypothetical protein